MLYYDATIERVGEIRAENWVIERRLGLHCQCEHSFPGIHHASDVCLACSSYHNLSSHVSGSKPPAMCWTQLHVSTNCVARWYMKQTTSKQIGLRVSDRANTTGDRLALRGALSRSMWNECYRNTMHRRWSNPTLKIEHHIWVLICAIARTPSTSSRRWRRQQAFQREP